MKQRLKKYRKIFNTLVSSNKCLLILFCRLHIRKTKLDYKIWGEYNFANEVSRNFNLFLSAKELKDEKLKRKLTEDIVRCYWLYGAIPNEYFMFDFRHKTDTQRAEWLTVKQKDELCIAKMGNGWREKFMEIENKAQFYRTTKQFFKRDVCIVEKEEDESQFLDFVQKHPRFIQKPLMGQCGRGTSIMEYNAKETELHKIFDSLVKEGGYILEELIQQDKWTSQWNESSVNTVRIPSIRVIDSNSNKTNFVILQPFFRNGRSGQVVDNGGSGGIFASIDPVSGKIISDACNEMGHRYAKHPDSNIVYKGQNIPRWNELVTLTKEIHSLLPVYHKYIGFDFALTSKGWVLIEANWGQFVGQYSSNTSLRKQFENLMNQ